MYERRLPTWSAVAIGLLAGALLGALLLLVRERTWRGDWEAERQAAIEQLLAEVAVDSAVVAGLQAPPPAEPLPTITALAIAVHRHGVLRQSRRP